MTLAITRKPGQSVTIGDSIIVTVVAVEGKSVHLTITAPKEVPILRDDAKETRR